MSHVHKPKDKKLAKQYREKGNDLFTGKRFCDSLEFYNKSLCFAENGSEDIALAYGNRSAVYLGLNEFDKCLENIQLARDAGFPNHKLEQLNERERRCNELKQQQQPNKHDDPWNFFKLSYPARKNYPAIVDCLELRKNMKFGRYIISNQDLKAGDVIAIEEPVYKALQEEGFFIRCANCLKSNKMSLIPVDSCASEMFCSQECLENGRDKNVCKDLTIRSTYEALHTVNNDINKLVALTNDPQLCKKTVFDLGLSNPHNPDYKYNQLLAINSLNSPRNRWIGSEKYMAHPIMQRWSTEWERKVVVEFMNHIRDITMNNGMLSDNLQFSKKENNRSPFSLQPEDAKELLTGGGLLPFASLLNHSCCPNIDIVAVDNKFVLVASHPIKKGEQLFICYKVNIECPIEERQRLLFYTYEFKCDCDGCKNDWKAENLRVKDSRFVQTALTFTSSKAAIKEYKRNCDYIQKNFANFPCKEIIYCIAQNRTLLIAIPKTEKFLFDKMY